MHFTRFRHRRNATYKLNWLNRYPREDAGGLSREYVLRIPNVSLEGRRYIAIVADTASNNYLTLPN